MATINHLSEDDPSGTTLWLKSLAARDSIPRGKDAGHAHIQGVMLKDIDVVSALDEEMIWTCR